VGNTYLYKVRKGSQRRLQPPRGGIRAAREKEYIEKSNNTAFLKEKERKRLKGRTR